MQEPLAEVIADMGANLDSLEQAFAACYGMSIDEYRARQLVAKSKPTPSTKEEDDAVAAVLEGTDQWWLYKAQAAIHVISSTTDAFTTDDVWGLLEQWAIPRPDERRAMGGAIKTAQAAKKIVATGSYIRSERPETHGRPVMVWRAR